MRMTCIHGCAGRVDWSHDGTKIAFDRKQLFDSYFSVWQMNPDGTRRRNISGKRRPELPYGHHGQPVWHPNGEWIVFQAQQDITSTGENELPWSIIASPGCGMQNDLWFMSADGMIVGRLYCVGLGGVLHAHFNRRGTKLSWSEYIGEGSSDLGHWVIKVADIETRPDRLVRGNIYTYDTGDWCESHGFHPIDDSWILFSGNADGQSTERSDIYWLHRTDMELVNITRDHRWNEHAQVHPLGEHIVWSHGCEDDVPLNELKAEWWIMERDGRNKTQLTHFNEPGHWHYLDAERAIAADSSWSPDGESLVGYVQHGSAAQGYILRLDDIQLP